MRARASAPAATTDERSGRARLSPWTAARTASGQLTGKVALGVLAVANTAIITRALGVHGYANWGTIIALTGIFGYGLDPGFGPAVVRRLARGETSVPTPRVLLAYRMVLTALVYVLVTSGVFLVRGSTALALALVLAATVFPRTVILNAGTWLQAHHRLHRQSLYEVGTTAIGVSALAALWVAGASAVLLAAVGMLLPDCLLAWLTARELRRLPESPHAGLATQQRAIREILREIAPLAAAIVLLAFYTRIDVVFVSAAQSSAGLAHYVLAFRFVEQLIVVASILAMTLYPMLVARSATRKLFGDRPTQETMLAVAALGAASAALMIIFSRPLIALIGGSGFRQAAPLVVLLAPVAPALFLNFFLGYLLMAIRKGSRYMWLNAGALVFNLATNAIFTLQYGAVAAARLTWMTELLVVIFVIQLFARADRRGRTVVAHCALLVVIVVAASEAAYAAPLPPPVIGAIAFLAIAVVGGPAVGRQLRSIAEAR